MTEEPVFPKRSPPATHGKGSLNNKVFKAVTAPNIIDEPLKSVVAFTSTSTLCFKNSIQQVQSGWCQLPPELLQNIAFLLADISDLARFRAVCTAWRCAVYTTRGTKPSCLPCLLLRTYLQESCAGIYHPCGVSFISCSFSDSYASARHVGVVSDRICGTGHGWVVVVSDLNLKTFEFSIFLWNPLTGFRIFLPSSASLFSSKRSSDAHCAYHTTIATIALLEGSNSPASGCIVMITWRQRQGFYFCRYTRECHEGKWTTVETFSPDDDSIVSFAYHQGKILAHHATGRVLLVDTASRSTTLVDPPPLYETVALSRCATSRIVEASGEVFLAVHVWNETVAYVFRLDLTVQPPSWCPTADIGDHALFIDFSQLQCVKMQDHMKLGLRKNCIYSVKTRRLNDSFTNSVQLFQLDKGSADELPLQFKSSTHEPSWLIPSLI